jgi:hypothetical protein
LSFNPRISSIIGIRDGYLAAIPSYGRDKHQEDGTSCDVTALFLLQGLLHSPGVAVFANGCFSATNQLRQEAPRTLA